MNIFINKSRRLRRRGPSTKSGQKGVSLIITFFIMIIVLAVVLSVSLLLYSEVKVIRNIGNSVVSFYTADSGIEKVLYYDRQVWPNNGDPCTSNDECISSPYTSCINSLCTNPLSRGLCTIPTYCISDPSPGSGGEHSIYCNSAYNTGSSCTTCDNCTVSFNTTFDDRIYSITAKVDLIYYLDVSSRGTFGGAARKIEIITPLD